MGVSLEATPFYHEVAGEGLPLVFLHGLGSTSNVWHAQRVALSKYFKVFTLDLPGSGRADKKAPNYSMESWTDQLTAWADSVQLERFVLIGHSMSTILAQKFAAKFGSRLHALVLCGAMTELAPAGREAFVKRAESVRRDGMSAAADIVLAGALTAATREANAVLAGLYRALLLSHDPAAYAAQCEALINGSAKADQPNIACPTLILLGDQDSVTPLSMAQAIARNIRQCRIKIIPATAHLTMAERPEIFNAALAEFLSGL